MDSIDTGRLWTIVRVARRLRLHFGFGPCQKLDFPKVTFPPLVPPAVFPLYRGSLYQNTAGENDRGSGLIVIVGPDIIFARFLAMWAFAGTLVSEPSRILIIIQLPELGLLCAPGWYVFIIFIVLVVFMPVHCNTISFVGVDPLFTWQWIFRIWLSIYNANFVAMKTHSEYIRSVAVVKNSTR